MRIPDVTTTPTPEAPPVGGTTVQVRLSDMIEDALDILYRHTERPLQLTIGATALTTGIDASITLVGGTVKVPATLECGQEQFLATAATAASSPTYTVSRGYAGTPASAHPSGSAVLVKPRWGRYAVRRQIVRALGTTIPSVLPLWETTTLSMPSGKRYLALPANTLDVANVAIIRNVDRDTQWTPFDQWTWSNNVPLSVSSTGKILRLPFALDAATSVYVTYRAPYNWSSGTDNPAESEFVTMPRGGEPLPALYAAAWLVSGRELTRMDVDRVEEWNANQADRLGVNLGVIKALWQQFYRTLDEAHRLQPPTAKHRQFRRMKRMV